MLLEGHASADTIRITFNGIDFHLPQLEKAVVSCERDLFSIGNHTFQYGDVKKLELENIGKTNPYCIQVELTDGRAYVLFPYPGSAGGKKLITQTQQLYNILRPVWEPIHRANVQLEREKETQRLETGVGEKIRKIMAVSSKLKLELMQQALQLPSEVFGAKIFDWAAEFGFRIDGDYVLFEGGDISGFIANLDREFQEWGEKSRNKNGKI